MCNIALYQIVSLSWQPKKKESKSSNDSCFCVGDHISVENHGKHWIHLAQICSINKSTTLAVVKCDKTLKKETVKVGDCKKYDKLDVSQRICKSTDFLLDIVDKKREVNKKSDELLDPPPGQMKNMFYSEENSSKLCT